MTSLYANEVIPMDPPLHTFLVKFGSNFRSKMRRIEKANNNREAACSDGEDLLLGSRVEVDIEIAWKKMECAYADFTLVPPIFLLEEEMLQLQLR